MLLLLCHNVVIRCWCWCALSLVRNTNFVCPAAVLFAFQNHPRNFMSHCKNLYLCFMLLPSLFAHLHFIKCICITQIKRKEKKIKLKWCNPKRNGIGCVTGNINKFMAGWCFYRSINWNKEDLGDVYILNDYHHPEAMYLRWEKVKLEFRVSLEATNTLRYLYFSFSDQINNPPRNIRNMMWNCLCEISLGSKYHHGHLAWISTSAQRESYSCHEFYEAIDTIDNINIFLCL